MKAILIARVSTEEQKEAGNSLPAQIHRLEQYCRNKGFTILRTCSFDESAYTNSRSEFDAIIDYALNQKEKVDNINSFIVFNKKRASYHSSANKFFKYRSELLRKSFVI